MGAPDESYPDGQLALLASGESLGPLMLLLREADVNEGYLMYFQQSGVSERKATRAEGKDVTTTVEGCLAVDDHLVPFTKARLRLSSC